MQEINSSPAQEPVWSNHQNIVMKENVGAGFPKDADVIWGLVIRNHREEVIYAATKRYALEIDELQLSC